ncbi:hypothetical protein JKP88DRAFT_264800 [Tribonema minus]|uniref:EF-hand domain-containing protein n=1 Tax=Tribonema minus TaxID=303371 RepID=A0A836CAN3_9STRA|nr:hypothetical protein JKP88DRAFT_264800 [Tribonema minus]
MGCTASRALYYSAPRQLDSTKAFATGGSMTFDQQLLAALKDRKWDLQHPAGQPADGAAAFSFTKILLKMGTIKRVLAHVELAFAELAQDEDGRVSRQQLLQACEDAQVPMDEAILDNVFAACEAADGGSLGLRGFVVLLAVARVMAQSAQRNGGRLLSAATQHSSTKTECSEECCTDARAPVGTAGQEGRMTRNASSFTKVKWTRIPSLQALSAAYSEEPQRVLREDSMNSSWHEVTRGWSDAGSHMLHQCRCELQYVLDLIIAAYFQASSSRREFMSVNELFDTKAEGFISRTCLHRQLQGAEGVFGEYASSGGFLRDARWRGLRGREGRLTFQGFVYIFTSWLDLDQGESGDDDSQVSSGNCEDDDDVVGLEI